MIMIIITPKSLALNLVNIIVACKKVNVLISKNFKLSYYIKYPCELQALYDLI